jgi:hypothetical protein
MTTVNKTESILNGNVYDAELIELIREQGAVVYYEMNREVIGSNRIINRLTFPVNPRYISCALREFGHGHVNYDINEDGTKTLKAYALYVTLLDCLETNIISIGGADKYVNKIVKRSIKFAKGRGIETLTVNILPIDRLVEYFEEFGFYKDRTYFIKENGMITDKIKAFKLIKEF